MKLFSAKAHIYRKCTRDNDSRVKQLATQKQKTIVYKNTPGLHLGKHVDRLYSSHQHIILSLVCWTWKSPLSHTVTHYCLSQIFRVLPFEGKAADQNQTVAPELDCQSWWAVYVSVPLSQQHLTRFRDIKMFKKNCLVVQVAIICSPYPNASSIPQRYLQKERLYSNTDKKKDLYKKSQCTDSPKAPTQLPLISAWYVLHFIKKWTMHSRLLVLCHMNVTVE